MKGESTLESLKANGEYFFSFENGRCSHLPSV
jgi:hypothetical protein